MVHKRVRFNLKPGDIIQLPVRPSGFAFAKYTPEHSYAFYKLISPTDKVPSNAELVNSGVMFRIFVMDRPVKEGEWKVVGYGEVENDLLRPQKYFIQDAIRENNFEIYEEPNRRPATRDECKGLECYAVWSQNHVEDRIEDYLNKRPCKWVEAI